MRILSIFMILGFMLQAPLWAQGKEEKAKEKKRIEELENALKKSQGQINAMQNQLKLLSDQMSKMNQQFQKTELENLKKDALSESLAPKTPETVKVFRTGERAQQSLNPEISFVFDGLLKGVGAPWGYSPHGDRSGFFIQEVELNLQADLDPYSTFKSTIGFSGGRVELEEVYMTWTNLLPKMSLTVGQFRQQFGVLNRWHPHAYDQTLTPLAISHIFGEEGLKGVGVSLHWLMPKLWAHVNELTFEITTGENPQLFSGDYFSIPSFLLYLNNYYDLSKDTYLEWGATGMIGFNNRVGLLNEDSQKYLNEAIRLTYLAGFNLTIKWSPLRKQRYRELLWRSEFFFAYHEEPKKDRIMVMGGYSYLQYRFNEKWAAGIRYDITQPFELNNENKYIWQINPYITFWQSEWILLRLSYAFQDGIAYSPVHMGLLQVQFIAGPHRHETY